METVWMVCLVLTGGALVYSTTTDPLCPQGRNCISLLKNSIDIYDLRQYCKALNESVVCLNAISKQCPEINKLAEVQEIKITGIEQDTGCDGKCVQSFGHCFDPVTLAITAKSELTTKVCKDVNGAFDCMNKLDTTTCSKGVTAALKAYAIKAKKTYFNDCDGASSLIFSTVVLVLGATVASLKNYI